MTQVETRQYDLAILIILVIFCWPAAIIYYFTRPVTVRYEGAPPQYAPQYSQPTRYCTQCGRAIPENAGFCPHCGKQLS